MKKPLSEKTKAEMARGAYVTAMEGLKERYDPDYVPPCKHTSDEEMARIEEYRRNHVMDWSKVK